MVSKNKKRIINMRSTLFLFFLLLFVQFSTAQYVIHFYVNQADELQADAGVLQPVVAGTVVQLGGQPSASGGTPPYSYAWSPGKGLSDSTVANPSVIADTSITYTLTVTDSNGCSAFSDVFLDVLISMPEVSIMHDQYTVFPNPVTNGIVNILNNRSNSSEYRVTIHNMFGQEIFVQDSEEKELLICLETIGTTPGFYIITIYCDIKYQYKIIVL